eukprot:UN27787
MLHVMFNQVVETKIRPLGSRSRVCELKDILRLPAILAKQYTSVEMGAMSSDHEDGYELDEYDFANFLAKRFSSVVEQRPFWEQYVNKKEWSH